MYNGTEHVQELVTTRFLVELCCSIFVCSVFCILLFVCLYFDHAIGII